MQESKYEQAIRIVRNYEKTISGEKLSEIKNWVSSSKELSNQEKTEIEKALDDKFNELRDKPDGHYGC